MPQLFKSLRRRNSTTPDATAAEPTPEGIPVDLARYPGIDELLLAGDMDAAITLVQQTDPGLSESDLARIDLQLRNEAFRRRRTDTPHPDWPPAVGPAFDMAAGVPDIDVSELTVQALIDGVRGHGALIVRNFFPAQTCQQLQDMIDEAFTSRDNPEQRDPYYFTRLCDVDGHLVSSWWRNISDFVDASVQMPDVPAAATLALAQFSALGVPELVAGYLGEQPALSLEKWTLRRVPPTTGTSWHQDGAFLGQDIHTINLWVTLTDAGETASGLDLVGKRFDHIVATGTPGAHFDWDVSPDVVEDERGEAEILSPVFKAGDAVFFDHYLLHRTGVKPGMTHDRYALESWFFTPSTFPEKYDGLLV